MENTPHSASTLGLNQGSSSESLEHQVAELLCFQFEGAPIRVVTIKGEVHFVASDVTGLLGFKNPRQAVRSHVARKDRGVQILDTPGGQQPRTTVNESGLYALIFGSTKPEALRFKHWVTSEVLPTIRQTGGYELQGIKPTLLARITDMLQGRGAAKAKQLNRILAHRNGEVSLKIGKRWLRHVAPSEVTSHPLAHGLREGLALSVLHVTERQATKARLTTSKP
jgi:prophage antirepressor-like protein